MKCPKCGQETSDDSMFCEHCGAKMEKKLSQTTKPWWKRKWILFTGFGVVLIVIALIVFNTTSVQAAMGDYMAVDAMGERCYNEGNFEKAFDYFEEGTRLENHLHAREIGWACLRERDDWKGEFYIKGLERRGYQLPDVDRAFYYFQLAGFDEYDYAHLYKWLGDRYYSGTYPGFPANGESAIYYYEKILDMNYDFGGRLEACIRMAIIFLEGRQTAKNYGLAEKWYQKYCEMQSGSGYAHLPEKYTYDSIVFYRYNTVKKI